MFIKNLRKILLVIAIDLIILLLIFFIASFFILKMNLSITYFKYISTVLICLSSVIISVILKKSELFGTAHIFISPFIISLLVLIISSFNGFKIDLNFIIVPVVAYIVAIMVFFIKPIKINKKNDINKIRRKYEKSRK